MDKIMELTNALGEEIKNSQVYKDFYEANEKQNNDKELQELIGGFNLKRESYMNENKKDNPDDEKLNIYQEEMRDLYSKIMANETMQKFLVIKRDFDKVIGDVYNTLQFHITGEEPHSCGSDCSSCSGCH